MTPEKFRAARFLLGLDQSHVASLSRVSRATIVRYENGRQIHHLHEEALRRAVEHAGVIFVPKGEPVAGEATDGGVVLRKGARTARRPGRPPPAEEGDA